jgi:hypothetical protein
MLPIAASVGGSGRAAQVEGDGRPSPRSREAGVHTVVGAAVRDSVLLNSSTRALSMGAERHMSMGLDECGAITTSSGRGAIVSAGQLGFAAGETGPMVLAAGRSVRPGVAAGGAGGHSLRPDPLLAAAAAATASAAAAGPGVAGASMQLHTLAH